MEADAHLRALGEVLGDLQGIELFLRFFLLKTGPNPPNASAMFAIYEAKVGASVELNAFTDYRQLRALIDSYNDFVRPKDVSLVIDRDRLAALRDALAHGRVLSRTPEFPLRLKKFSPVQPDGKVQVIFDAAMDAAWFADQKTFLGATIDKIMRASAPYGAGKLKSKG